MRNRLFLGLIAVLILAAAGLWVQTGEEASAALIVHPTKGAFQVTVTTTGELQAKNSVKIYGPRGARRARIFEMKILRLVPEGTVVEKGDFVAELDRSQLTSNIKDAELELQKAQSQYEQTRLDTALTLSQARNELVDLHYAMEEAQLRKELSVYEAPAIQRQAEIDYEKARRAYAQAQENYETKVKQARAKMREVGAELSQTRNKYQELLAIAKQFTIYAPADGMVVYRRNWRGQKLTTGGTINAWDPVVATLPDLSSMESVTYVNEVDIHKIRKGQPVKISLDANPDKILTGTVTQVANIGQERPNSDAKVFEVVITVNEADTTLRPAMTTSNTILVAERTDVLSVPLEAVHAQDSLSYVFARRGGGLVRQEVKLGLLNANAVIVKKGLSTDDRVYLSLPPDTSGLALRRLENEPAADELAERK